MQNSSGLDFLLAAQNPDGGWGYAIGQASIVEATAAVVLALRDEPSASQACEGALGWLRAAQHRDGGWGIGRDDQESGWQTGWAALVLARTGAGGDALARGVAWLLAVEVLTITGDELQRDARKALAIDASLRGWPWLPGQASWIEPTALALWALAAVPPTAAIAARTAEAVRYVEDRRCAAGGWNVGNPVMLDANQPPRAHPTSWALLALAGVAPEAILPEDVTVLRSMLESSGASGLAWGMLALRSLDGEHPGAAARLSAMQTPGGGWNGNPYDTAVAMLAEKGRL